MGVIGDRGSRLKDAFDVRMVMQRPPKPRTYPSAQAEADAEISCLIIEQAVLDWKKLEYGKLGRAIVYGSVFIYRAELESFFRSSWFEMLLSAALPDYTSAEIRKQLQIRERDI